MATSCSSTFSWQVCGLIACNPKPPSESQTHNSKPTGTWKCQDVSSSSVSNLFAPGEAWREHSVTVGTYLAQIKVKAFPSEDDVGRASYNGTGNKSAGCRGLRRNPATSQSLGALHAQQEERCTGMWPGRVRGLTLPLHCESRESRDSVVTSERRRSWECLGVPGSWTAPKAVTREGSVSKGGRTNLRMPIVSSEECRPNKSIGTILEFDIGVLESMSGAGREPWPRARAAASNCTEGKP